MYNSHNKKELNETIIVIGAGINGLASAWRLSKKGHKVIVLERQNFPGGLATSIIENGFKMDIGPHFLTLPKNSHITNEIKKLNGNEDLIEIEKIHESYRVYFRGELLKKLKISEKSKFLGIPRYSNYHPEIIPKKDLENKFIIFSLTRQDWGNEGNDKFLIAFKKLLNTRKDIFLIMSKEGPDIDKSIKLLPNNNDNVKLIPNANFKELQYYYNLADVIVDQFALGSFGMISIEAMMCKKPIIIGLDTESFEKINCKIPGGMLVANDSDSIMNAIINLLENEKYAREMGEKKLEYFIQNRDPDKMIKEYITIFNKILKKEK